VDEFRSVMSDAMGEYDMLFAALTDGNADLGIGLAEESRKMQNALRGMSLQWDRYKAAVQARLSGQIAERGPDYVSRQNLNVMHSGKYLISEVINHYTIPPALLQGDAFTLDIVARQRSLSQQIAKEACGVITDNGTLGRTVRLQRAVRLFDASYNALVSGFPGAGVSPPPTPAIKAGLDDIAGNWSAVKAEIDQVTGARHLKLKRNRPVHQRPGGSFLGVRSMQHPRLKFTLLGIS